MATRSLTEVFILMRNNASQNRHIFNDQADDRRALISAAVDVEQGSVSMKISRLPPEWSDGVEEVQFEISRIKTRMKDLQQLHDKHLNRPTLDDSVDEEHEIEIQTQEITKMFHHCQSLVHQISAKSRSASGQEEKLTINIVTSLARGVQDLSINFKKTQSTYLKKLKSREERSRQFFDSNLSGGFAPGDEGSDELTLYDKGFSGDQLQVVEDNTAMIEQREKEIAQIVRSIQDLNEIFKDLAGMIVDQGTLLDRIDYNIEQTSVQVDKGLQQLQKAEGYQKKNRKMLVIVILAIIIILLLIILIAMKSNK